MGRRRITPPSHTGLNPAAAHVPSVLAAAAATVDHDTMAMSMMSARGYSGYGNDNGTNSNSRIGNKGTTTGKRAAKKGNGNLTNHQRKIICEFYQKSGGVMSQKDLAQWTKHEFGLKKTPAQSTISGILRRQHEFTNMSSLELGIKKRRVVQHPELDNALANWVIQCAHRGITVQGDMTKEKAKHFAKMLGIPEEEHPEFSNGWLHSFQLRHNFSFRKFNGDGLPPASTVGGNGMATSTSTTTTSTSAASTESRRVLKFTTLEALVEETAKYDLNNVFAMAEMGVLYNLTPCAQSQTQTPSSERSVDQQDPLLASKRFVAVLACNANGSEKLPPLFVSHHEQPQCFRRKTAEQHSLQYFANSKAWITGVIFSKWLQRLDFAMATQKRRILLLLNEAPSHAVAHLELTNTVVHFVPEDVTVLNPLMNGIVSTLKMRYRRHHLRHVIDKSNAGKPVVFTTNVLQAMLWAMQSWDELTSDTIERGWSLTQLLNDRVVASGDPLQGTQEATTLEAELSHLLLYLRLPDTMPLSEFLNDDAKFDNSIHEEYFEVVQAAGNDIPDDDYDEDEHASKSMNLSLQDKLRAFRDVLHVLKDRMDSESEHAVSTLRRVHDAIRSEVRPDTNLSTTMSIDAAAAVNGTSSSGSGSGTGTGHGNSSPTDEELSMVDSASLMNAVAMQMSAAVSAAGRGGNQGGGDRLPEGDFHTML